jgi:hypothetical protein
METGASTRASDDDRRRVVGALERHTTAGRLRLDEFEQRVAAALAAITLADLAAIVSDLPPDEPVRSGASPHSAQHADARSLMLAFSLAALTLIILAVILTFAR